jgi:hypothetical protein
MEYSVKKIDGSESTGSFEYTILNGNYHITDYGNENIFGMKLIPQSSIILYSPKFNYRN